ncbi:MAG TPA: hypothetical protein VF395_04765 [Polyangiaceae bacterium]
MRITRLGQGVDETGFLHPDAILRTTEVLAGYAGELARHGVTRVRATATSAARDAGNRDAFFDAAERALGVRPELLPADEEARLSFRGATAGLPASDGPFLVVDIGGGSTEFVLGSALPEALISVKMGCVRMTERHFRNDPPTPAEMDACIADVRESLVAVKSTIDFRRARLMIGLAGTVTTLASLQQGLKTYSPTKTHHARLTRLQVEDLLEPLSTEDIEGRRALLAEPERARVIVAGTLVLVTILRELDISELMVSESDILDGLAASLR